MNAPLVGQQLVRIAEYCRELAPLARTPRPEFVSRPEIHHLVERYVQLIVDSVVDINNSLILEAGGPPPPKYFDTFVALGRLRILPAALAGRLVRTTGLRNRIVHEYESVDLGVLHRAPTPFLRDFTTLAGSAREPGCRITPTPGPA